jgi:hypothetical protein
MKLEFVKNFGSQEHILSGGGVLEEHQKINCGDHFREYARVLG